MRARSRLSLVAGLTAFLTLVGGGGALALWSTSASVNSTASAATTGLTQALQAGDTLKVTYSASVLGAAGAVTIANTGSRSASYALAITAASTTIAALPAAVSVAAAAVASVAACTTSAALTSPTTGVLSTTTAVTPTGTVAAGASVVVCVKTSMTATNVTTYADGSLQLSLQSSLAYGTGPGQWAVTATAVQVQQKVASALLFFTDSSARYNVLNLAVCVSSRSSVLMTSGICDADNSGQFRIAAATNGTFSIAAAVNSTSQPSAPQWALSSATSTVTSVAAAAVASQHWTITKRADGTYRLLNESFGTCATVSTTESYPASGFHLVGAVCNDALASQGFTFTQVSSPIPLVPYVMSCTGAQWNLTYNWTIVAEYRSEVAFQTFIDGVFLKNATDAYNSTIQLTPAELPVATWGNGSHTVTIKQSIAGSPWITVATGTVRISGLSPNAWENGIYCS